MSIYVAISFAFGAAMFALICWAAWRIGTAERGQSDEDADDATQRKRIDSIRQNLRPEGDTEVRASDFAALEPHTHIRAGRRE